MRQGIILSLMCVLSFSTFAQEDTILSSRLEKYMLLTKQLDFEKLMDYIHPDLFKIAPKEKVIETFQNAFNNEMIEIIIDSTSVSDISPSFIYHEVVYKKIDYYMSMQLKFKDTSVWEDDEFVKSMSEQLKKGFENMNINYIKEKNYFRIDGINIMFAIKDKRQSVWMFLGYDKRQATIVEILFPGEVLTHFNL